MVALVVPTQPKTLTLKHQQLAAPQTRQGPMLRNIQVLLDALEQLGCASNITLSPAEILLRKT